MAITFLKQTFGRRYSKDINGDQSAIRNYLAISSTAITDLDDLITDALAAGLPALDDSFSVSSPNLVVTKHNPSEVEKEKKIYNIEVAYNTNRRDFGFPTTRPWDIEFYSISQEQVAQITLFDTTGIVVDPVKPVALGQPIQTTAAFPFTDPPVVDFRSMVGIKLSKNFTSIAGIGTVGNIETLMSFTNTVNNNAAAPAVPLVIAGISGEKYQFWMQTINCVNTESGGEDYYATTFDVIYDPQYHIQKILNAGWHDNNGLTIKNEEGGDISNPWPLDVNGAKIVGVGATPALKAADRASKSIYRGFGVKPPADWAALGLPTTF